MCRFLLLKSNKSIKPKAFLEAFATMSEKSRTTDGDRQCDGWGIAWKEKNTWKEKKSLSPIWEDQKILSTFPETKCFAVHARSAGFVEQIGTIEYNQPYIYGDSCFVFNGMVRGVNLPYHLDGKIGAQKIFSLLRLFARKEPMNTALDKTHKTLLANSREIEGMNIAISHENKFYILCEYDEYPEYFTLCYFQDKNITLVCSEPILSYNWKSMKKGEILVL